MLAIPIDVDGLSVSRDVQSGDWVLDGWGRTCRLREWTWAERRHLVDGCRAGGEFDATRFLRAMLALLVDPAPPEDLSELYGYVCLELLQVDAAPLQSLTASEVRLAREFGWGPRELAEQPAMQVDRLLAYIVARGQDGQVAKAEATPSPTAPGSYSIVIVDDADGPDGGDTGQGGRDG